MKKLISLIFLLTVMAVSTGNCVYRGFNGYAADGAGGVVRSGYALYLPWTFPFRHYEKCAPAASGAMECKKIKVHFE
jgi:hypothetical protein